MAVLGLIFDIVGVFILTLVAIIDYPIRGFLEKKNGGRDIGGKVGDPFIRIPKH